MIIIKILLAMSALYSGGMYGYCLWVSVMHSHSINYAERRDLSEYSFWLALCFILSLGFLGLILSFGG